MKRTQYTIIFIIITASLILIGCEQPQPDYKVETETPALEVRQACSDMCESQVEPFPNSFENCMTDYIPRLIWTGKFEENEKIILKDKLLNPYIAYHQQISPDYSNIKCEQDPILVLNINKSKTDKVYLIDEIGYEHHGGFLYELEKEWYPDCKRINGCYFSEEYRKLFPRVVDLSTRSRNNQL